MGYWNNPEATKQTFINNLLLTGDRYMLNEKGEFIYLGRNGDMYKSSGLWVSAIEIETQLKELDYIVDAAVCVFMDAADTQKSAAFVVPTADGFTESVLGHALFCKEQFASDIKTGLAATISRYKLPDCIFIIDELPRTATGKVAKHELKQLAKTLAAEWVSTESSLIADTEVV